jgi:hypothetical protein
MTTAHPHPPSGGTIFFVSTNMVLANLEQASPFNRKENKNGLDAVSLRSVQLDFVSTRASRDFFDFLSRARREKPRFPSIGINQKQLSTKTNRVDTNLVERYLSDLHASCQSISERDWMDGIFVAPVLAVPWPREKNESLQFRENVTPRRGWMNETPT